MTEPSSTSSRDLLAMKKTETTDTDTLDFTVIRYNQDYSLRTKAGRYLTAVLEDSAPNNNNEEDTMSRTSTHNPANKVYVLGCQGYGIGDTADSFRILGVDNKDATGPVKYGSVVLIKSMFAKEG
jgi:hypothetical protein